LSATETLLTSEGQGGYTYFCLPGGAAFRWRFSVISFWRSVTILS